jgi:hypothetical protein
MHYGGNDINDNDTDQDRRLPLKSFDVNFLQYFTAPAINVLAAPPQVAHIEQIKSFGHSQFFPVGVISSSFRPPQA